jgi:hypothetical protein
MSAHWIRTCKPAQRASVVSGAEVIEPGFLISFFGGELLVDVVVGGAPEVGAAADAVGNLFAKRQVVMPGDHVARLIGDQARRAEMIGAEVARRAGRRCCGGVVFLRQLAGAS